MTHLLLDCMGNFHYRMCHNCKSIL
jgi:hypothetical protein